MSFHIYRTPSWHVLLVLQAIQRQLEEVEERQRTSEIQGVKLEKVLRGEAGRVGRSTPQDLESGSRV